ncbi:MAG: LptF/LptG family permease, partial [Rhodospirillales bacterium]|nr:LptF/LptG family permease [Rhodospirillales bacterium]
MLRQLLVGMVFVSVALACVLWLTQSLRFVELIVNKGLSIGVFLYLTLLLLPNFLIVILPISLFAVVLFAYNRLNSDRELVVMRAAGMSQWALASPALILAFGATLIGYALNLYFVPRSVQDFRELQWTIRNDISGLFLQEGVFTPVSSGVTVFVRARNSQGELLGVLVHDKRNPDRIVTMMAERGALVRTSNGPRVLMVNGSRQEVAGHTGRLSMLYFDTYAIDFGTSANVGEDR